ncbi:putative GTPase [Bacillus sp. TS-2]|nr:putative GTPase [Bacillus sp. TS-2]
MKNDTANLDFFHQKAIGRLKKEEKEIYLFIIHKELKLERIAQSAEEYLTLLKQNSPIVEAAHYFGMDALRIYELLDKAEFTIAQYIKDMTDKKRLYTLVNHKAKQAQYFFYYE